MTLKDIPGRSVCGEECVGGRSVWVGGVCGEERVGRSVCVGGVCVGGVCVGGRCVVCAVP